MTQYQELQQQLLLLIQQAIDFNNQNELHNSFLSSALNEQKQTLNQLKLHEETA